MKKPKLKSPKRKENSHISLAKNRPLQKYFSEEITSEKYSAITLGPRFRSFLRQIMFLFLTRRRLRLLPSPTTVQIKVSRLVAGEDCYSHPRSQGECWHNQSRLFKRSRIFKHLHIVLKPSLIPKSDKTLSVALL